LSFSDIASKMGDEKDFVLVSDTFNNNANITNGTLDEHHNDKQWAKT
jgi:hypothetical protein